MAATKRCPTTRPCGILRSVTGSPRRTIVAWTLYDFANSAFSAIVYATVFPAYYANTVVGNEQGRGDFWWGLAVSVSMGDRKSTRLNSSHSQISYAVFCLKKKKNTKTII